LKIFGVILGIDIGVDFGDEIVGDQWFLATEHVFA
jgi:hypothetical protein